MQSLFLLLFLFISIGAGAQLKHPLRDTQGRHMVARGFVVVTNDTHFTADDYARMVRLGANCQVVRLELGKLSSFPGGKLQPLYLQKLDTLVALGKDAGISTFFKMTVYGIKSFSWEDFWQNKDNQQETYIEAWRVIWNRYKDESAVCGYDLVNEPRKLSMDISYDELTRDYLLPLYRRLIDESHKINKDKYCLVQSIFMNKGEKVNGNQYAEIKFPLKRKNVLFAPHIYQEDRHLVKNTLLRFAKESELLDSPVFIGEWGFPTFDKTDSTLTGRLGQLNYMDFYMRTAELFDSLGYNTIKAWFAGNPQKQHFLPGGPSTWAIFNDTLPVGTTERKYITDIIARPYPQLIAGDLHAFRYDFATRSLRVLLAPDNKKGVSRIFVGANRHYPDGFTVTIGNELILVHNPLKNTGLEVRKNTSPLNPSDVVWDESRQQLLILKWPESNKLIELKLAPGVH